MAMIFLTCHYAFNFSIVYIPHYFSSQITPALRKFNSYQVSTFLRNIETIVLF